MGKKTLNAKDYAELGDEPVARPSTTKLVPMLSASKNKLPPAKLDSKHQAMLVPMDQIKVSAMNMRIQEFLSDEMCGELMESIKISGLRQPVELIDLGAEAKPRYELIAGSRRLYCCKRLYEQGALPETIRSVVRRKGREDDADWRAKLQHSRAENIGGVRPFVYEEALKVREVITSKGIEHKDLAQVLGFSRSYITQLYKFGALPIEAARIVVERDALSQLSPPLGAKWLGPNETDPARHKKIITTLERIAKETNAMGAAFINKASEALGITSAPKAQWEQHGKAKLLCAMNKKQTKGTIKFALPENGASEKDLELLLTAIRERIEALKKQ